MASTLPRNPLSSAFCAERTCADWGARREESMQTKLAALAFAAGIGLICWQGARAVQARTTTMDEGSTALGVQQGGTETEVQPATHRRVRIAQKGFGGQDARAAARSTYSGGTKKPKYHQSSSVVSGASLRCGASGRRIGQFPRGDFQPFGKCLHRWLSENAHDTGESQLELL